MFVRSFGMRAYTLNVSALLVALLGLVMVSCSKDEALLTMCSQTVYYHSAAVCAELNDAAVRDDNGALFIAKDLFLYIDRAEVTVDFEFRMEYEIIQEPDYRVLCGPLIVAPVIQISCFELADQ